MLRNCVVVSTDGSSLPATTAIEGGDKVEYIPLEYAQKKINKLVTDYTTLKSHYDDHITQLNDFHVKTNSEMKDYYENFIKDLKKKALSHLTIVKRDKETIEAKLTEEVKNRDIAIENLRDVIANKNSEYQENIKKLKSQHTHEDDDLKLELMKEKDALIAKFQSISVVSEIITKVEFDQLKRSKSAKVKELISEYENKISATVLSSKGKIDALSNDFDSKQKTRQEVTESLQNMLFSIESNYVNTISDQFDEYYESLKSKELKYKNDLNLRVSELLSALEDTKKNSEERILLLQNQQAEQSKVQSELTEKLVETEALASRTIQEQRDADEARWNAEKANLIAAMQEELSVAKNEHADSIDRLTASYERQLKELEGQMIHMNAQAQTVSALGEGMHHLAIHTAVSDLQKEHQELTDTLVATYEAKILTLKNELSDASKGQTQQEIRAIEVKLERVRSDAKEMEAAKQQEALLFQERAGESPSPMTQSTTLRVQTPRESPRTVAPEPSNEPSTSTTRSIPPTTTADVPISITRTSSGGIVEENALVIQKSLTLKLQKENKLLQERISSLEKRIEDMRVRAAAAQIQTTSVASPSPEKRGSRIAIPAGESTAAAIITTETSASLDAAAGVFDAQKGHQDHDDDDETSAAGVVQDTAGVLLGDKDSSPPTTGAFNEAEAMQTIEELEEELYHLRVNLSNLEVDNAENIAERKHLQEQLDIMIKEKRTDVVGKFEEDIKSLRSELLVNKEALAIMKEEKTKNESKIKELKERSEKAEAELKERDEKELATLNPTDEKTHLKTQVVKQREDIIMKSKAATAGWDAAASADKRLEIDVDKAYERGLTEAANRHSFAMSALNEAIEKKETRITELLINLAAAEKSKKELEVQLIEAKEQAALGSRGFGGYTEDGELEVSASELQEARDNLDSAHEEVAEMATKMEQLQIALDRASKKQELYEKLLATTKAAASSSSSGPSMIGSGGGGASSGGDGSAELKEVISLIKAAVMEGTKLWRRGAREQCYELYLRSSKDCYEKLGKNIILASLPIVTSFKEGLDAVIAACRTGTSKEKDKGAVSLRKVLDKLLVDCEQEKARGSRPSTSSGVTTAGNTLSGGALSPPNKATAATVTVSSPAIQVLLSELAELNDEDANTKEDSKGDSGANSILRRAKAAEAQVEALKKQLADMMKSGVSGAGTTSVQFTGAVKADVASSRTIPKRRGSVGMSPMEAKKLQKKVKDLEEQLAKGGGGGVDKKALEAVEKKAAKQVKDLEAVNKKSMKTLEDKVEKLTSEHAGAAEKIESLTAENTIYKGKVKEMSAMLAEMESLKSKANQLVELKEQLDGLQGSYAALSEQFKKENALRKKYKNELEDLKGAIRVYARCRPFAQYEIEKGCQSAVRFTDDTTMKVASSRGEKDFEFDAAFTWNSTQEEVFEDTRRLVESCLDGYNVCVFAYGQTGSGKTHTMTGSPGLPGLTPRAVDEIFNLIRAKSHCKCTVTTYFVELYNDNLVDLFWILDNTKNKKSSGQNNNAEGPPKLDIRLDAKNMVYIRNSVIKEVTSAEEMMVLFNKGNAERHTGATKMNASSSRSHSIFAIMVETVDSVTKKTITGKMSLVDLAGSERADKTGASAERLKEAQSINKSLSALGDVIAALSEGEKFIPYRNNKLTQLMQDSLGGNAKTLMFVNFSPADYNADETTTSLQYAARVKKIVNNASKQAESEEVTRLKAIIRKLQSGGTVAAEDLENIKGRDAIEEAPPPVIDIAQENSDDA